MLSLTGHWPNGKAYADEQIRCLNFARLGYVVLAPDQSHYEDLPIGISHQTHMVWSNIRALDLLQSLNDVDPERIGACGGSGGGYQAQMLLALDDRIRAATIMGFTCDYRETIFPHVSSCTCVHYPGALTIANQPEVSALGMPVPVQYLTMDDYTKNFRQNAFTQIDQLYRANGYGERVECKYWPTDHVYDKPKRDATYKWMQKWLRGDATEIAESATVTFPIPRLVALDTKLGEHATKLDRLSEIHSAAHRFSTPGISTKQEWVTYRQERTSSLGQLLGLEKLVPVAAELSKRSEDSEPSSSEVVVESFDLPVEGTLRIPLTLVRPAGTGPFSPTIYCSAAGRRRSLAEAGDASPMALTRGGRMVVVPDLRFFGEIDLDNLIGVGPTSLMSFVPAYSQDKWLCNQDYPFHYHIQKAWQRNAILWKRPLVGMMVSDIRALIDYLAQRGDVDMNELEIVAPTPPEADAQHSVPLAALLAAAVDPRIKRLDVDLGGRSFEERSLPVIPFILWHGDVLHFAACAADRKVTLRNVSQAVAGDLPWLKGVFAVASSADNLEICARP
jgi:dienelactone hydrolase